MEIMKVAMAGTLESSDVQIIVEPGTDGIELSLESSVIHQYGNQIKSTVMDTLSRLGVTSGSIRIVDKGALDCTIKARLECAVYRSNDITEEIPWGGAVRS